MEQRSPDPFFEQLKVDIEEGIAAADRGELLDLDEVRDEAFARLEDIQRSKYERTRLTRFSRPALDDLLEIFSGTSRRTTPNGRAISSNVSSRAAKRLRGLLYQVG